MIMNILKLPTAVKRSNPLSRSNNSKFGWKKTALVLLVLTLATYCLISLAHFIDLVIATNFKSIRTNDVRIDKIQSTRFLFVSSYHSRDMLAFTSELKTTHKVHCTHENQTASFLLGFLSLSDAMTSKNRRKRPKTGHPPKTSSVDVLSDEDLAEEAPGSDENEVTGIYRHLVFDLTAMYTYYILERMQVEEIRATDRSRVICLASRDVAKVKSLLGAIFPLAQFVHVVNGRDGGDQERAYDEDVQASCGRRVWGGWATLGVSSDCNFVYSGGRRDVAWFVSDVYGHLWSTYHIKQQL